MKLLFSLTSGSMSIKVFKRKWKWKKKRNREWKRKQQTTHSNDPDELFVFLDKNDPACIPSDFLQLVFEFTDLEITDTNSINGDISLVQLPD